MRKSGVFSSILIFATEKVPQFVQAKKQMRAGLTISLGGAILHHPRHKHFYTSKIFLESLDNL